MSTAAPPSPSAPPASEHAFEHAPAAPLPPRRATSWSLPPSGAPPRRDVSDIATTSLGMLVALAAVTGLAELSGERLVSAALGATAIIIFALPGSPLAQPRAAIGGQCVAAACGLAVGATLGSSWMALALAGALALAAMSFTRTLHAPAGATALIVVLEDAPLSYLVLPVFAGTVLLVLVAYVVLNARPGRRWPEYWW